ncbi:MAG TPA: hypothetical protein VIT43_08745 [Candidatus Dormibacteraeota bacterium]
MSSLDQVVRELRAAASRTRAAEFGVHGLAGALLWVTGVLLLARVIIVEARTEVALVGVALAALIAAAAWIFLRPTASVLMAIADLRLGLKERLSTAWERRDQQGPMDPALRQDALTRASSTRLGNAFPLRVNRGEASLIAILAIFALALSILPNPMDQMLARHRADQASQARAAKAVAAAKKKVSTASSPSPKDAQVEKILQDTQAKIQQAGSPRQALESITPAEQQLQRLSDPGTPALSSSAQNLANALSGTDAGRTAAQAISQSPSQGAQALRNLGSQLQNLTPQQRQQLAQALAKAAQQAQNSQMRDSLNQASSALQSGDTASAQQALNDVASQLDSLQQQENTDQAVASAINGLESARQELASQADRDASGQNAQASASAAASAGASAAASGSGNSNGNGNGSGNGTGNGNGTGTGTGSGNGSGTGSGGSGGTGGTGSQGSGSGSGAGANSTERLYVPGQPVPGQSENDPTPLGPGQDVPLTPYNQVIQGYQQAAKDATDQSLIPGSERDLIREYFSQLGEPKQGAS